MPGLNRQGPHGEGPMTGKKMGRCNPDNKGNADDETIQNKVAETQEQSNVLTGRGPGRARGSGKGLRARGNS